MFNLTFKYTQEPTSFEAIPKLNPFTDKTKFERIQLLRKAGLNVPEQIIVNNLDHWRELMRHFHSKDIIRISIRTWRQNEWNTPHYPNVLLTWASERVNQLLAEKYVVSVTPGIDPNYTCVCGTVLKKTNGDYLFEIAHGPGTVRRIMVDGEIDLHLENPYESEILETIMFRLFSLPDDTIYEWSWYHIRIGYKKQNLIFWEALPFGEEKT